jgi:hypothetical protein
VAEHAVGALGEDGAGEQRGGEEEQRDLRAATARRPGGGDRRGDQRQRGDQGVVATGRAA